MTETAELPIQEEAQAESKIAQGFKSAREKVMQESAEVSQIYRSITKPGAKDIYNAWVKNMDVVAKTYSWGKDKPAFRTRLMFVMNRLVGISAATLARPTDMILDALTWLPRKTTRIGRFIPDHFFAQRTIKSSENAKNQALIARGLRAPMDVASRVVGGAFKHVIYGTPVPEGRVAWEYTKRKVSNIKDAILHPKLKAV